MLGKLGKKVLFFERLVIGEEKKGKKKSLPQAGLEPAILVLQA